MRLLSVVVVGAPDMRAGDYDNPRLDGAAIIIEYIKELEESAEIAQGSSELPNIDLEDLDGYKGTDGAMMRKPNIGGKVRRPGRSTRGEIAIRGPSSGERYRGTIPVQDETKCIYDAPTS